MTQAPDPLPGAVPRSGWAPAPGPWPGEPAGTREPTSTNAGYPPVVGWPTGGSAAGRHADGTGVPGWGTGNDANGPLPNILYPTAGPPVSGSWSPDEPWVGRPGGYPAQGAPPVRGATPFHADPGYTFAPGYTSAPGYVSAPAYLSAPRYLAPGFGAPSTRQRPARPGSATTAGVLGIVYGSLILFAALVIWAVPLVFAEGGMRPADLQSLTLELIVVSMFTAVCGVVLVVGGILIFRRDRSALMFGAVTSLLLSTYWLVRTELDPSFLAWPLVFAIIPVIILVQCVGSSVVSWIRWRPW